MFKLVKYLKPFIGMLVLAIVLLFVQAMTDLTLPDYMSKIVNKGIQQGGIESAVPKVVRKSQMDRIMLFIEDENKAEVLKSYKLVEQSSSDYDKYVKNYPSLEKQSLYILEDIDSATVERLNPVIGKALITVTGIQTLQENSKDGEVSFGDIKVPANADVFAVLAQIPTEQRVKLMEGAEQRFAVMGDNVIIQAAAGVIRNEYEAIGINTDRIQSRYIMGAGYRMLLLSLLGALCTVMVGFLASRIATGAAKNLRRDIFTKVESFSNSEFDKFSTASLITRTTNDVTQIQMVLVMGIRMVVSAPIMGIGGIIKALGKSSSMSWIIALAVLVLMVLIGSVFVIAMPKFKAIQKLVDRLNLVTRENLSGMMVIRAFNTQSFEEAKFNKANKDLTDTNLFVNRVTAAMFPVMMFVMNSVSLVIVWVGAHRIADSSMQVGDMMAFMQYAMQIIMAFLMMSFMFIMIPRASVSAQRVSEVLNVKASIEDPKEPKSLGKDIKGIIEFKNVSFRYPRAEEDVLKDISFKALPGETTAFIGSTGSGKSTLINLIPRFYDVTNGQITIDGLDIRDLTQHELRDQIGYVPQKGSLFKGTIESNLRYGYKNATHKDLNKAAEVAQAMEFIGEKPEGFNREIAQGGSNVSGGQKQRLSIARALVKKPRIYIFDDSFSALDFKTDSALRKALNSHTASSTLLIVAQRISTIKNAKQIIVLDEGRIVGIGTHEQLMSSCKTYQEIALSQLSREELA